MKLIQVLAFAGISMLGMSNSCQKESDAVSPALTTGRVLKYETTLDDQFQHPRPRWIIDIAPLSLAGWAGDPYQQAKVFNLPDTTVYKAGQVILFHYQLVPQTQQTPWETWIERHNMNSKRVGAELLPELTLSDVQLVPANAH